MHHLAPSATSWVEDGPIPESDTDDMKLIAINTDIYLIHSKHICAYSTTTKDWVLKSKVPEDVHLDVSILQHGVAVVDDCLYIVGGDSGVCVKYNTSSSKWTTLSPPLKYHKYGAAVEYKGHIYLSGGMLEKDSAQLNDIIEEYAIGKDEWRVCDITLPVGLCSHTVVYKDLFVD